MTTEIVSCRTLEIELGHAMAACGVNYPTHYTDSELHNAPGKLKGVLQGILDGLECDRVLLVMGFCGGGVEGLETGDFELVIPRVDDCISLLMGFDRKQLACDDKPTYFLTQGWLNSKDNIWIEYNYCLAKYGPDTSKQVFDLMFGNYVRLGVLDCGCYDVNDILAQCEMIASALKLETEVVSGTTRYIRDLLTGPWGDDCLIVPPHTRLTRDMLKLPEGC